MNRRDFISATAGGALLGCTAPSSGFGLIPDEPIDDNIQAVLFDGFPIFDPRPIFAQAVALFPEQGQAMSKLWFTKIFGYTWLRTLGGRYIGFQGVIEDALDFSADTHALKLTSQDRNKLLAVWTSLDAWPDVKLSLELLAKKNIKVGFLSNLTEEMLRTNSKNAGIDGLIDFYLSTDRVQAYKPSPIAYQMGIDLLDLPKKNIAFAAFAGWDAAGADWFGYKTIWVNRLGFPNENLDANTIKHERDLPGLLSHVH